MKKLSLIIALVAGGFLAQDAVASNDVPTTVVVEVQEEYSAIDNSELPAAVAEAFTRDFPNVEISKAYMNDEGHYKLEVTQEDGSIGELYADAEGNWIEM